MPDDGQKSAVAILCKIFKVSAFPARQRVITSFHHSASRTNAASRLSRRDMACTFMPSRAGVPVPKRMTASLGCRSTHSTKFGASKHHLSNLTRSNAQGSARSSRFSYVSPSNAQGSDSWANDPDDQRRINENKSWRRTDAPEDAWDIDKERDAVMYKRESLERLLSLTPKEEKPDRPVTCLKCGHELCRRSDETQKDKAHVHRHWYNDAFVSVSVFGNANVRLDEASDEQASKWWAPRDAFRCRCANCNTSLGWQVSVNPNENVGPFYALLTSRLKVGKEEGV